MIPFAPETYGTPRPTTVQPRATGVSIRSRFGIAQWMQRLNAPDSSSRASAARALARYTPEGALRDDVIESLAERLRSESELDAQAAIVDALALLARDRAVTALLPIVCTRGALAPPAARSALAFIGPLLDRDGIDAIINALAGTSFSGADEVRTAAIDALAAAPDEPFSDRVAAHRATPARLALLLEAIGRRGDGRWGAAVLEQLQSAQRPVVIAAIRASAQLRLLEAASPIARIIRERTSDADLQNQGIVALAAVGAGDPEATREALKSALRVSATTPEARRTAALLGVRALVADVAAGLESGWRVDRRAVAEALADIGGPDATRALVSALEHETDETSRRVLWRSAIRADETAGRRALESAPEGDRAARWAALELVVRHATPPRMRATRALAQAGDVAAMALECAAGRCEAAVGRLADADVARRTDAAWALTFAQSVDARAITARFEAETDPAAKTLLAFALMRATGDGASVTAAFERFALRTDQALTAEQAVIAELAARRGSSAIRRAIPAMIEDRRAAVRALALWIGARTEDHAALATARRLSQEDASADVRRVAAAVNSDRSRAVTGSAVLHAAGLAPRTLWFAWLPDGQVAVAVTASDGTLLMPNAPSGAFDLETLP